MRINEIYNRRDNRGMSLVEVIIAITILGLVAVPVLHSLTTAMVYNAKARNRQEMTLTAESIMETFKGYSLEELVSRFGGSLKADGSIENGAGTGGGIEGVNYQTVDADSGYQCASADIPLGTELAKAYTFQINDMKADNEQLYDVTITATPNSVESIVEMEDMEPTRDAIFKADRKFDTEALGKARDDFARDENKTNLKNYFSGLSDDAVVKIGDDVFEITEGNNIDYLYNSSYAASYVGNYIRLHERRLTFTIDKNASDEYVVTPKMVYRYCLVNYPYYVKVEPQSVTDEYEEEHGAGESGGNVEPFAGESRTLAQYPEDGTYLEFEVDLSSVCKEGGYIYKNPAAAGLNRLVVYYYPQYDLTAGNDKIIIDNAANIPDFQCYILKQRAADINDNNTKIKENSYQANVQINNSAAGFEIFHNFDDNIADGSSTTAPYISETTAGVYSYTKDMTDSMSLAAKFKEKEVLSYKLELKVTQDGRPITKLESSMNEGIK